jgi:hypothetical protein
VPSKEGFLALGREHAVDGTTTQAEPQREQEALRVHAADVHPDLSEVNLGGMPGQVGLRHESVHHRPVPCLQQDLRTALRDILRHRPIRDPRVVLVDQPLPDPMRGMPLLRRCVHIRPQHLIHRPTQRPGHRTSRVGVFLGAGTADASA